MKEELLYDPIGKWLVREKGCQQDKYSQGYLKNIKVGDVRPDVFAIKYEVIKNYSYPVIHFHGYIVEVKSNENLLNELIGKAIRLKEKVQISKEWMYGLHTARFYIAYPAERISSDVLKICRENDIGILRLQIVDENRVNVYEVLKPKKIELLNGMPHSRQRSRGIFIEAMENVSYLKHMFQTPDKLFDEKIRPLIDEYNEKIKINQDKDRIRNRYAREALDFLLEKILAAYPQLKLYHGLRIVHNDEDILKIPTATDYFYIELDKAIYRVYSKDKILEFKRGVGEESKSHLEKLIDWVIIPHIKNKVEGKNE
ncbi:hypothetical protein ABOONEI_2635 [Aciduliprofundum boonei T469]|nr:hypothetical protein ABOONEI_2635 [Aciduliprofundum boonei T469]